jgi:hypothetical protein
LLRETPKRLLTPFLGRLKIVKGEDVEPGKVVIRFA